MKQLQQTSLLIDNKNVLGKRQTYIYFFSTYWKIFGTYPTFVDHKWDNRIYHIITLRRAKFVYFIYNYKIFRREWRIISKWVPWKFLAKILRERSTQKVLSGLFIHVFYSCNSNNWIIIQCLYTFALYNNPVIWIFYLKK